MNTTETAVTSPTNTTTGTVATKHRILVVDDDDEVRRGLRCVLVMEGYEVTPAANGSEAVEAIKQGGLSLALLDVNMPKLNGWGTIAELRSLAPGLPVILITARPDQRTLAREASVELMEKPLDLPHLLRRVAELVGRQ